MHEADANKDILLTLDPTDSPGDGIGGGTTGSRAVPAPASGLLLVLGLAAVAARRWSTR